MVAILHLIWGGWNLLVRSVGTPDYRGTFSVVVAPDLDPNVRDPDNDGNSIGLG